MQKLSAEFYQRDVLIVAPELLGKRLVRRFDDGTEQAFFITETEAYRGDGDLACHASKGRTQRTEVMYLQGGLIYMYLVYGMYWMLNIVAAFNDEPQAVLIRGIEGYNGPGKLTKALKLDKSFYGEDITQSSRLWVEEGMTNVRYTTAPRVGIDYAGEYWKNIEWRFILR